MKYTISSAVCALTVALTASAFAESTSTTTTTVTLSPEQRTEVREYVVKEHRPSMRLDDFDVRAGATLPSSVEIYTVPKVERYRYTVVNEKRVLVDPESRRIVEVFEGTRD